MKYLFVYPTLSIGGIEVYLKDLAIHLTSKGDDVKVMLLNPLGHSRDLLEELISQEVDVEIQKKQLPHWFLTSLYRLEVEKDRILVSFDVFSFTYIEMAIKGNGNRHISGIYHIDEWNYKGWPIMNFIAARTMKKINGNSFFMPNEYCFEKYKDRFLGNPVVLPIGIKIPNSQKADYSIRNRIKVILAARVVGWKSFLWQVVHYLNKTKISYELHVVGEGNEYQKYKDFVLQMLIKENVFFYGNIPKHGLVELASSMDIGVSVGTTAVLLSSIGLPTIVGIENSNFESELNYGFFSEIKGFTFQEKGANLKKYKYDLIEDYLRSNVKDRKRLGANHMIEANKFNLSVTSKQFRAFSVKSTFTKRIKFLPTVIVVLFFFNKLMPKRWQYWQRRIN